MKKNKKGIFQGKSKWIIISTIIFAILGITALILGFGLTNGWMSVLMWFGSRWAIYVYIVIALVAFIVIWVYFKGKIGED